MYKTDLKNSITAALDVCIHPFVEEIPTRLLGVSTNGRVVPNAISTINMQLSTCSPVTMEIKHEIDTAILL